MAFSPHCSKVVQKLSQLGIIPPNCVRFEMVIEGNNVRFRSEVLAEEFQVQAIAEAFEDRLVEVSTVADDLQQFQIAPGREA